MASVECQSVSVRTDATEGSRRVVASEGALIAHFQALVHVLADLIGAWRKTVAARTLETAVDVATCAITADVLHAQALVVVHAPSPGLIQHVSRRTLASERAVRVDAFATGTSVRHEQALVQIDSCVVPPRSFRTQPLEFLCV